MTIAELIAARATYYATIAQDTWKLGTLTSTGFREITELCTEAVLVYNQSGDHDAAAELLDDADILLDALT